LLGGVWLMEADEMKRIVAIFLTTLLVASVRPVFAQAPGPEAHWDQFLSRHPGLAEHPERLNNPAYLNAHPNMKKWLDQHPAVFADARREGMWDHQGNWHDSNWWNQNQPAFWQQYHPEWAQRHPDWAQNHPYAQGPNDGDWDENHQHWYSRDWWVHHHRDWVEQHHHDWLANHPIAEERHEERQEHREHEEHHQ